MVVQRAAAIVRFVLEVAALVAFAAWALQPGGAAGAALALLAVVAAATYWGILVAPKSTRRLRDPNRLVTEVVFFGLAALAAGAVVGVPAGVVFAVLAIGDALVLRAVGEV